MAYLPRLASVAFILALPVFLVTGTIRLYAGEAWFYERGFRAHDADESTGLPLSDLDRAGGEIRDYFENDARFLAIAVGGSNAAEPLFTEEEVLHMADVKDVMRVLFRVNEIALAIVLGTVALRFLWAGEAPFRTLAWDSLKGLAVGLAVVVAVAALAAVGFDAAWEQFHELLFRNDFWQLDPDSDRLIQMFPEAYWQESVAIIAVMIVVQGLAIAGLAGGYLFATRERGNAP